MRRHFALILSVCLLGFGTASLAQKPILDDLEVKERAALTALSEKNTEALSQLFSPYLRFVSWRGRLNRNQALQLAQSSSMGAHGLNEPKTYVAGNVGLLTYNYDRPTDGASGPTLKVWSSSVYIRVENDWVLVGHAESRPASSAPPADYNPFEPAPSDALSHELYKAIRPYHQAQVSKSVAALKNALLPEFDALTSNGRHNRNQVLAHIQASELTSVQATHIEQHTFGSTAVVTYHLFRKIRGKPAPAHWVMAVLVRRGDDWMPLFVQEAADETPAAMVKTVETRSGLKYTDLVVGGGAKPQPGQTAIVHYTGWLLDGSEFDSSITRNQPFEFKVGARQVIAGWDEGVSTMAVGGRRRLLIPPSLGYGERGAGPKIPPNSTLLFEIELLGVRTDPEPIPD